MTKDIQYSRYDKGFGTRSLWSKVGSHFKGTASRDVNIYNFIYINNVFLLYYVVEDGVSGAGVIHYSML